MFFYIWHTCDVVMRFFVVWHVFFLFVFSTSHPGTLPSWHRKVFGSPGFYLETPHQPGAAWWMATSKHVAKPFLLQGQQVPQGELQKRKQRHQQSWKQKQLRLTFRFWDVLKYWLFILYNDFYVHATLFCRLHWDDTLFDIMFLDNPFLSGK